MLEFSGYTLILFAHVLSGTALVGHSLGVPLVQRGIRQARSLDTLLAWLDYARLSARWNPAVSLALLASGLYLAWTVGWLTEGWVLVSVASWVINSILAVRVVDHTDKALGMAASRAGDGPIPAEVDRLRASRGWALASLVMVASDVTILFLMVAKPGLAGSIIAFAVVNALVVGLDVLRR